MLNHAARVCASALLLSFSMAWIAPQAMGQLPPLPVPGRLVVTMTSPGSGSTVAGTVPVSASVTIVGSLIVAGVQFRLDGANLGAEDTTAAYSIPWNTTTAANGSHTLTAVARDLLGGSYTSDPITVTVSNGPPPDNTRPTVSITSPGSGATVSGTITVTANASDNVGVANVQFQLDGVNSGPPDSAAPYSISWNTTTASNGSHRITAVARDAAGNVATSAPVTVTVSNNPTPPPDTTRPTVSITSPASGATISGTITVTSNASDNVGVASVQFQLDGANVGAPDTAAPYSISWNTSTSSNGSHTITAVARDAAGNVATSAPVTVTVSNNPTPPPDTTPPTVSITSPASAATVSGTITVTANASDNVGVAGVQFRLDGVNGGAPDTTAPYSIPWDTSTSSNGSHTITAIAADTAGNTATSAPVTVIVSNGAQTTTVKRFEETDASVTFTDGWNPDGSRSWSGKTAAISTTAGATATFVFTGPSVSWIGSRAPQTGTARVSLDGALLKEVDTYSRTTEIRVPVFTATGLVNERHTLTIEVTGAKNPAATSAAIVVDAFDVPAPAVSRLQETDPAVTYSDGWTTGDTSRGWSAGSAAISVTAGTQATFTFRGTAIDWIGARGPQSGIARVSVDGVFVTAVDAYAPTEEIQAVLFTAAGLADASHTLTIEVTGGKNAAATSTAMVVDGFEVTSSGTRVQETDPAVTYSAGWSPGNRDKAYSEGTAAESKTPGARATFTFTGTGIKWIGGRGPVTGTARVSLDGEFITEVDTYSATEGPQNTVFTAAGLAAGSHALVIEVTGLKNPAATDAWILVDAFDVTP